MHSTVRVFGKMSLMVCVVYLLLINLAACQDHCDPQDGPAGQTICYYDNTAKKLTWSSCVSNTYIKIKSAGADQCEGDYNYCAYGCLDEGVLTGDCDCPVATEFMPVNPTTAWCFDPPGDNTQQCIWYRECLGKMWPCEDSDNGYALAYGESFCNLYTENVEDSLFSQDAVDWIDAVRKCLQVALVPLLRRWHSPTCRQIQDVAFASHTGCYLSPAPGARGICSLGFMDWLAVFWTIKGSFISAPTASLRGVVETASGCRWKIDLGPHPFRWLRLELSLLMNASPSSKRSTLRADDADVSSEIADGIARALNWDDRTLDWFGYAPESMATDDTRPQDFNILIVDKLTLGLTSAPDAPLVDLNKTASELVNSVANGTLRMLYLSDANVTLHSITECYKMGCPQLPPHNSASSRWQINHATVLLVTLAAVVLASL